MSDIFAQHNQPLMFLLLGHRPLLCESDWVVILDSGPVLLENVFELSGLGHIITRRDKEVRGVLHATIVAFDKHWNMALTDVLEVWKRKRFNKRKVLPGVGTPVPKGTAATISSVPVVSEAPVAKGIVECKRHIPQMMVRGEHIVLVYVVER